MMRRWKILILALTLISAIAGPPTFASANQSLCDKYLPRLQGNWYDSNGNVYLQIVGKTLNGCPIVDIVNAAGGGGDVGLTIRISELSEQIQQARSETEAALLNSRKRLLQTERLELLRDMQDMQPYVRGNVHEP